MTWLVTIHEDHDDPGWNGNYDGVALEGEPMVEVIEKEFFTEAEARAFVAGVEYVNDSMVEVWSVAEVDLRLPPLPDDFDPADAQRKGY